MIDRLVGGRRHYAWLIVLVTFVTLITTAGFRATPGVLIVPLQDEFGWSRGTISLAVSLGLRLVRQLHVRVRQLGRTLPARRRTLAPHRQARAPAPGGG